MNAINELTLKYIPLVHNIVRKMTINFPPQVEHDDLISSGCIGLIDAIDKYQPEKGVKFATYAKERIRGSILDELRSMDWMPRSVRQKEKKIKLTVDELENKLDRSPEDEEIANRMKLTLEEYYKMSNDTKRNIPVSIDRLEYRNGSKDTPFSLYQIKENKERILEILELLPEKQKRIILLYYFDDFTMKEIGVIFGVHESRISQIHMVVIQKLRKKLKGRDIRYG